MALQRWMRSAVADHSARLLSGRLQTPCWGLWQDGGYPERKKDFVEFCKKLERLISCATSSLIITSEQKVYN